VVQCEKSEEESGIHRRDAEDTEGAQREESNLKSLRILRRLCVSAVNLTLPFLQFGFEPLLNLYKKEADEMSIKDRRAEIDAIDRELLRLLNTRAQLAVKVGEWKRDAGLSLCDRAREREVIEHACHANTGPLDEQAVARLFRCIIRESRLVEGRAIEQARAHQKAKL
jgi:chorismate mutase